MTARRQTEAQARKLWCPHALAPVGAVAVNRPLTDTDPQAAAITAATRCLASDCAAWRSAEVSIPNPKGAGFVTAPGGRCGYIQE